ncbi:type B 50S ribosomal protein L31 [soil metagenome]
MKKGIHPEYRPVVFMDHAANFSFLTRSTVKTTETTKWTDGEEYPVYKLEISSASHPFFTGKMKFVDTAGRVEGFMKKYKGMYGKKTTDEAKPEEGK